VAKSYNQYCPLAHALDVVGERWSLLIVRELFEHDSLRYSDLHANLAGCGTNILASRLKELERHGVVQRRRLPPPAASTVYELTEYGEALRPVMHELAHWGAASLGPPSETEELQSGWLKGALEIAFPPNATSSQIEFRIGSEVASFAGGDVLAGSCESADAVVEGDPGAFYRLVVERDRTGVRIDGDVSVVDRLLDSLPAYPNGPSPRTLGPYAVASAAGRS
jgi:DNA-binding HxlR family transcriptional regulator